MVYIIQSRWNIIYMELSHLHFYGESGAIFKQPITYLISKNVGRTKECKQCFFRAPNQTHPHTHKPQSHKPHCTRLASERVINHHPPLHLTSNTKICKNVLQNAERDLTGILSFWLKSKGKERSKRRSWWMHSPQVQKFISKDGHFLGTVLLYHPTILCIQRNEQRNWGIYSPRLVWG